MSAFLDLLYSGADESAFHRVVADAVRDGLNGHDLADLERQRDIAVRLREQLERQRSREAELTALNESANDLIAIRDVDAILAAIVRRARQLLGADMTYLSLNDEAEGASFMKVTDGSVSAEFRNLRLPLGTGLLGLVAQTGAPYHTDDYQHDSRFVHREYIDHAVDDEGLRAILGVPLLVEGTVIGALLATHRTVRAFPPSEVSLLTSFAAHAAVALENARLFEAARVALAERDETNRRLEAQTAAVSSAAAAHDRLTSVLLLGGEVADVGAALGDVLGGRVSVYDVDGRVIGAGIDPAGPDGDSEGVGEWEPGLAAAVEEARGSGRAVDVGGGVWVAAALAGAEHLGSVVIRDVPAPLDLSARRTLERGAMVTALVLTFNRSVADAEERLRGDLLTDLLAGEEVDRARLAGLERRHEVDLDRPLAVVLAAVGADLPARPSQRRRVAELASRFAADHDGLGGAHQGRAVVVVPDPDDRLALARELHVRLAALDLGTVTGAVAGPVAGAAAVAGARAEAEEVLRTLLTLGRAGETGDAAALGLARLVLGHNGPDELADFVAATLGPVLEYDERRGTELVTTLEAWFADGGSPSAAAARLHVHPNTVTQRLDRIGSLLGEGWRNADRALEQQLALQVHRLRR